MLGWFRDVGLRVSEAKDFACQDGCWEHRISCSDEKT